MPIASVSEGTCLHSSYLAPIFRVGAGVDTNPDRSCRPLLCDHWQALLLLLVDLNQLTTNPGAIQNVRMAKISPPFPIWPTEWATSRRWTHVDSVTFLQHYSAPGSITLVMDFQRSHVFSASLRVLSSVRGASWDERYVLCSCYFKTLPNPLGGRYLNARFDFTQEWTRI